MQSGQKGIKKGEKGKCELEGETSGRKKRKRKKKKKKKKKKKMNIYVSNLSWGTNSESLQNLFAQHGEVASAAVITDKMSGRSRGFGFVEMPDNSEAKAAIEALNETEFEGKTINVAEARPREDRSNDRGRGGFGGGNRGGGYGRNRY